MTPPPPPPLSSGDGRPGGCLFIRPSNVYTQPGAAPLRKQLGRGRRSVGLAVQADARTSWTHAVCASTDRSDYWNTGIWTSAARTVQRGREAERASERQIRSECGRAVRCFLMLETGNLAQESSEKLILTPSNEAPERNPEVLLLSGARFNPAWR